VFARDVPDLIFFLAKRDMVSQKNFLRLVSLTHRSYPALVARFAPRPLSILTVEQAVKYHRSELQHITSEQIRSDVRRGNLHSLAQSCGLAHALWEYEDESSVREALAIMKEILDFVLEVDPKDEHNLHHFVMDLMLEVGQWDDATQLLSKLVEEAEHPIFSEDTIWTAVLICFKTRGPTSKTARRALERAVLFNKSVYALLVGERLLEKGELAKCRENGCHYFKRDGRWCGQPENAPIYFHRYVKYFHQEPTIFPWLKAQKNQLQPILDAGESLEQHLEDARSGDIGVRANSLKTTLSKLGKHKVCCSNCSSIGHLMTCKGCEKTAYCSRQCQRDHWKKHRVECKKYGTQKEKKTTKNDECVGQHPSWKRLNIETRKNLLAFHQEQNWTHWPVTAETSAMLNHPCYSFLTMHPEMMFSAAAEAPPHSFRISYADASCSNVHGKMFPPGQAPFLLLREQRSPDTVPLHDMGKCMEFCLVAEVRYTNICQLSFTDYYNHQNKGRMFDWPGVEAVETCPGTGNRVVPCRTHIHVLAAFQMHGFYVQGDTHHPFSRVIPRIITKEGLHRLAPSGSPCRMSSYSGPGALPGCETLQDVYPDLLRRFAGQKNVRKDPKHPPTAYHAWEAWHESGRYCAYERRVDKNSSVCRL